MLVVEDGSGVTGANSYVEQSIADDYWEDRGDATWDAAISDDKDAALVRATASIDATYRGRFPGYRTHGRGQELEWPRTDAYDTEDNLIAADEIPVEIIEATCEAALRELATPGATLPDLQPATKRIKAGSVEIEYASNASDQPVTFQTIDGILSGILISGSAGGLFGVAVRG